MVEPRTTRPGRPHVGRRMLIAGLSLGALGTGLAIAVVALRWLTSGLVTAVHRGGTTLDEAIGLAAVVGCWLCVAWFGLAVVCAVVGELPGAAGRACGAAADLVTPWTLRTIVVAGLGLTLANGPGAAAAAGSGVASLDRAPETTAELNGWTVGTADEQWAPSLDLPPLDRPADDGSPVVVQPGDCLWSIAARWLGGHPADAQIAAAWPRWYDANRSVIGPDPNLLQPGQVLVAPR